MVSRYARENLALVNVYIKDPSVTQVIRDQKVPLIWFVANIGGILGLTMGMSLVTMFEILHHIVMLFFRTGVKSIASVRRTMTVTSLAVALPMKNIADDGGAVEQQQTTHLSENGQKETDSKFEEIKQEIHSIASSASAASINNGYDKKKCMSVFVDPSNSATS